VSIRLSDWEGLEEGAVVRGVQKTKVITGK
jgi:hypothetical protein